MKRRKVVAKRATTCKFCGESFLDSLKALVHFSKQHPAEFRTVADEILKVRP